ncbi:hypothetical protein CRM22_006682 [Opisthorchis felineus]|uniref:Uncharacterized protein n=1 Tax=Opisthorchis felineus TaxID=147828 RepID=A0A4S2LRA0_OPIFE|nr:hypothetical protein CRM22_006682 [Opisthorchis felineus]
MVVCVVVAVTALLGSVLSEDSEEYDTCMLVEEDYQYLCPGKCSWIVRDLCFERNTRNGSARKTCETAGQGRCIAECAGVQMCLEYCDLLYNPQTKN